MNWIVVQTKCNCENKANVNLVRQGFECFLPKILKVVRKSGGFKRIKKPLFPGYIFVNLRKKQNWLKINYTFGVNKILKFNENLCFLPNKLLLEIKKKCDLSYYSDSLIRGDEIKIVKSDSFILNAIFDEYIDSKRSYVLIDFLKRKMKTRVNNNHLILKV